MKTNPEGRNLISSFQDEYEAIESLTAAESAVNMLVKHRMNSNQLSALVCLVMSIGIDDFKKKYVKLVNQIKGDAEILCQLLDIWRMEIYEINDNGDRILDPFLQAQRDFEIALFTTPVETRKRKGGK